MKTYAEIKAEIDANSAKIKELSEQYNAMRYSEQTSEKGVTVLNKKARLEIANKALYDNARQAYFSEVIPVIVEEFKKYVGKPYGEKTKAKISMAVKERAGCNVYLANYARMEIIPLDRHGYSGTGLFRYNAFTIFLNTGNYDTNRFLTEDNKITDFPADALFISNCADYTDDVNTLADTIKKKFAAARAAYEAYQELAQEFNKLRPSGIEQIDWYKAPRYNMI